MFKIGDFSKLAQVSVRTLRYYGELGLLQPAWIDRFSGYRYYTASQLPRLNRILALKDLGLSLEQIRRIIQADLPPTELRGMLHLKQAELERQLEAEKARLERVEARLRQIEREGCLPAYEVVVKSLPSQRVAGRRQVVSGYRGLPALFSEVEATLREYRPPVEPSGPGLAIYFDTEFRERGVDVEAALPVARQLPSTHHTQVHMLEGAEQAACVVQQGAYEHLGEVYSLLMTWIEANGYRVSGPNREVFLQPDLSRGGPAEGVTEVQFPIQKKPLSIYVSDYLEKNKMEPKIITKPAFTAVGMLYYGKNEHNEIAQLWQAFNPRINEIKNITDGAFGICGASDDTGAFKYLAGFAVSEVDDMPPGMEAWQVPAQQYAVFPCTLETIHDTYKYAFETWLPTSGYEYTKGPDFEYYDENFDPQAAETSTLYIYIPIK